MAGRPGFDSRKRQFFFVSTEFTLALGPTQPLIQWVRGNWIKPRNSRVTEACNMARIVTGYQKFTIMPVLFLFKFIMERVKM
jgi:hypothetical protein